ncbi:MAG TPA: YbaK/EbsC family protein [Candidatus Dormibacteraeota bacterium]|nr:YbaK/EbsC family protein [Candidatus Dormibacteraeota bacterium]
MTDDPLDPRVRASLDGLGVEAEVMPCDPDLADTAAFCEAYGVAPEDSANCILVAGKADGRPRCACVVLATTRVDVNRTVTRLLGVRKASFASAEEIAAVTGMLVGGVTPFGLPESLPVFVDGRVMTRDRVVVGGGSRSAKLRITPGQLLRIRGAQVVDGLAG